MKSIQRLVLALLVFCGGALCAIFMNPRKDTKRGNEPSSSLWDQVAAAGQAATPSLRWEETGFEAEPARSVLASSVLKDASAPSGNSKSAGNAPAIVFAEPSFKPKAMTPDEAIARLLRKPVDLANPLARRTLVAKVARLEAFKMQQTKAKALALGLPLRTSDGAVLAGFEGDHPLYDIDHNVRAAISTAADLVQASPYNASGFGFTIGLWEAGDIPRVTHQEFGGRLSIAAGQTTRTDLHASHVAGILIASGINPLVKGMAPSASVLAHDTNSEISEMIAAAAAAVGEPDKVYLSNHSYGYSIGWATATINGNAEDVWFGTYDSGTPANSQAYLFGRYGLMARNYDDLSWDAPYYLIFKSVGNDRNDSAPTSGTWFENANPSKEHSFADAPPSDRGWMADGVDGFGTLGERSSAKNVMVVGSVTDAVSSNVRNVGVAALNSFSSAGPTDDGRIKPDLMANGNGLISCDDDNDTDTATASGTSMASPNACGSALLLIDYYDSLYPGQALLASSLKGLLIHTADDIGNEGPDYRFGWGLMNVKEAADLIKDHYDNPSKARLAEGELDGINTFDEVTVSHDGNGPLRVTICWTDPAGNATSIHNNISRRLVHDLNLSVVGPSQTHLPFVMPWVTSNFDNSKLNDDATPGVNTVDNVEQVYLKQVDAPAGNYTIRVDYAGVLSQGAQKYSLFLTVSGTATGPPVVQVINPLSDMFFVGDNANTIEDVADVNTVFSAEAVSYEISVSPAGIISAVLQGDGTVDITPTPAQFGTATVTLTATDAGLNEAVDEFEVTIASPILHVDADISVGAPQDGYSWPTAFKYLQDALAIAQGGQEIWVAGGVYYPDQTLVGGDSNNRATSFTIPAGVSLFGGFAGGETVVTDAQPLLNSTHLSGDIDGNDGPPPGSYANGLNQANTNTYIVVDISAAGTADVLNGFVISGGYAVGTGATRGGGIYSNGGSATISRCTIAGSYSSEEGAGVYLKGGNPKLINCLLSGNWSGTNGGGLWIDGSDVDLQGCEFRGNEGSGAAGFGVTGFAADARAVNCIISGNKAFFGSGGVQILSGDLSLTNCTLNGNHCFAFEGGGLLVSGSNAPVEVNNCIIWKNYAGGTTGNPGSSVGYGYATQPVVTSSLVEHSGGSSSWVTSIGSNGGGNLDDDPKFVNVIDPGAFGVTLPNEGGDLALNEDSPALNAGSLLLLPLDPADLDNDGDLAEQLPVDLAGNQRVVGPTVDMGPYEAVDLNFLDTDGDGMSDAYEIAHSGTAIGLNPFDDTDGDGLTTVMEYALGLDPAKALTAPPGAISVVFDAGQSQDYLTITYEINDDAVIRGAGDTGGFVTVQVERITDLTDSYGWKLGETVPVSADPIAGRPGMLRIVERSILPMGYQRSEYFRLRSEMATP